MALLAEIYLQKVDVEKALEAYNKCLEIDPAHEEALSLKEKLVTNLK